jgi:hypothetical protein
MRYKTGRRELKVETLGIVGFVLVLAGWLGMFFRVRREYPKRNVAKYGSYTGPTVFGFRFGKRSAFSLVMFYWQHYGADAWLSMAALGVLLIAVAAVGWGS